MDNRLLPPPPVPPERAVQVWMEMIDLGEYLLREGFAARYGRENVEEHYRAWCREQVEDQDRRLIHLLTELGRREKEYERRSQQSDQPIVISQATPS